MSDTQKQLESAVHNHPYPLVFATISGAHLYGFASPDSDYDLRGVHILPARELLVLDEPRRTIEQSTPPSPGQIELDLVTHDLEKFIRLMLRPNGYVLEQLYSPLVVFTTQAHQELKHLGAGCITRHHAHHYVGFAQNQWQLFAKENPPRIKPLLYVYRVLLTGIHLMNTGKVQANLLTLNEIFKLPYIDELVQLKTTGREKSTLNADEITFHKQNFDELLSQLADAARTTTLPAEPSTRAALSDLLLKVRLSSI